MFNQTTKHCYIHVPFCKYICSYCDFKRIIKNEQTEHLVVGFLSDIKQRMQTFQKGQFDTMFLGGGTPNCLSDDELEQLLSTLSFYCSADCEFTIECNPDLITNTQAQLFLKYNVNRISIGVQSTNNEILKQINRIHSIEDVSAAIKILQNHEIKNISCDFIYALQNLTMADVEAVFTFVLEHQIPHVSFYALEIKSGSLMKKLGIVLDEEQEADQMHYIIKRFEQLGYQRYEVANWCIDSKYQCKHNLAYWLTKDWVGLGYGAHGFEDYQQYYFTGKINAPDLVINQQTQNDLYVQVLMMGLRLVSGLDLNQRLYYDAYLACKNQLKNVYIDEKNHLHADDINLLHNSILDLF